MRVNVYAEEMTDRVQIIEKETDDGVFTGLRFYLELPVTVPNRHGGVAIYKGPFMHKPDDDDSSAVTFWGKQDLRLVLFKALDLLDVHYESKGPQPASEERTDGSMRANIDELLREASKAVCDVLVERQRQISEEGWTPDHDDGHTEKELAVAAGLYALFSGAYPHEGHPPPGWPWEPAWWKPRTHRRNMEKAAALAIAEIERIDRLHQQDKQS